MIKIKTNKNVGTLVVLMDSMRKTLILLRSRDSRWAPSQWGFPGGKIEAGETSAAAAIRETKEETQLAVQNLKKIILKHDLPCAAYYTTEYEGDVKIDHEHEDWKWVDSNEIENYDLAPGVLEMYQWVLNNE